MITIFYKSCRGR